MLDPSGEQLTLVDDTGHVLSPTSCCSASSIWSAIGWWEMRSPFRSRPAGWLPRSSRTGAIGCTGPRRRPLRSWRRRSVPAIGFAANREGGVILPGFLPAFDAAGGLLKMLDLLAARGAKLSEIVAAAPVAHMTHDEVITPWEQKGTVMRSLVEQTQGRSVDLIDGVKVHHDHGWVLVLPDPEEPMTHIWSRGRLGRRGPQPRPGVGESHPPDVALARSPRSWMRIRLSPLARPRPPSEHPAFR